jgi:hypothetical protein
MATPWETMNNIPMATPWENNKIAKQCSKNCPKVRRQNRPAYFKKKIDKHASIYFTRLPCSTRKRSVPLR